MCPMECNRTSFVYHLAEVDLMGEILVDFIKENPNLSEDFFNKPLTPETVKQNVIRLSVFSDKLAYTLSTEFSWTSHSCARHLISDLFRER